MAPDYRGGDRRLIAPAPAPACYADWFALAQRAADRFWSKVRRGPGCHPWMGGCDRFGYGKFKLTAPGHKPQLAINVQANRLALELTLGRPLRDNFVARHTCDNPPCCNANHLLEGTQKDNIRDREERGRGARRFGEDTPRAVLTPERVRLILELEALHVKRSEIAAMLGVRWGTVDDVLKGVTWGHVTGRGRAA